MRKVHTSARDWRATTGTRKASLFKNGANQAVRLPQEMRFPDDVREVIIRRDGNKLVLIPAKPGWADFFRSKVKVPNSFLRDREDVPPQERELP
jgi:antitoxin VapB